MSGPNPVIRIRAKFTNRTGWSAHQTYIFVGFGHKQQVLIALIKGSNFIFLPSFFRITGGQGSRIFFDFLLLLCFGGQAGGAFGNLRRNIYNFYNKGHFQVFVG